MTGAPQTAVAATAMQEALWWVHQRAKNQSVYNLTWRLACPREPDFDALAVAWQAVVDRHEALRTAVLRRDGAIVLEVAPAVVVEPARVVVDDPGELPVGVLLRLLAEEVHEQTIALEAAPLARLTVVRVGDVAELILTAHHVVVDGWALQLVVSDLSCAYAAALRGEKPTFPAPAVPFSAYARELHEARDSGAWRPSLAYWPALLDGAASTTVAADRTGFAGTGAAGVTVRYAFSPEAATGVAALAGATFATPFAIVLAALQIVLSRGGAGDDVAVGAVVANRMTERDQALVGYLANLCISRARISATDTVLDVVSRSRDAMWAMLTHQGVPYPAVFAALSEPTRAMLSDYAPLLLNYLGPIGTGIRLGDLDVTLHRTPNRAARSDIAIAFWESDSGYLAEIEYNTGRYEQDTVLALLADLDAVLADGGAEPSLRVADIAVDTRAVRAGSPAVREGPVVDASPTALPAGAEWATVAAVWERVLGAPPGGPDEDFFAVGGRSLRVLQLAAALETETGTSLDVIRWLAEPTPRRLAGQLTETARPDTERASTLVTLRDGDGDGDGPHLHLVHGAGGGPRDYRALADALPGGWRVTVSQEREPQPGILAMAARYRADLDEAGVRPDVLAGWSMGGQVAYAMAGGYETPPRLAVLDGAPPVGYDAADPELVAQRQADFVTSIAGSEGAGVPRTESATNPELPVRALAAYLAALGQPVPAASLLERWRTFQRHTTAVAGYVAAGRLAAPAVLVGADLLDAQLDQWAALLEPEPRRLRLAADHFGVLSADHAGELAAAIEALMA